MRSRVSLTLYFWKTLDNLDHIKDLVTLRSGFFKSNQGCMQNIPVNTTNFCKDTPWCFVAFGFGGF